MHGLEKSVNQIAVQETDKKIRGRVIELLNEVISDIEQGISIWKGYLTTATGSVNNEGYGGWAGFTIEADLFNLHMASREKAWELSKGGSSLDAPLVNLAYAKLKEGQSDIDAANGAIAEMQARIEQIQGFIEIIEITKPTKVKALLAEKKSTPKKSNAKKKVAKKKVVAKKATPKKKATKKKVAVKKTAKKKAVPKKAVKKKAVKKKAVTKKAVKKRAKKK